MNLTRIRTIGAVTLVSVMVSWILVDLGKRSLLKYLAVPWSVSGVILIVAGAILVAAWPVRQYTRGKRQQVDPLRAASVLALAKACTLAGAALAGLYLAMVLHAAGVLHSPLAWARLWQAAGAAGASVILTVSGRVAEWFCRLPPEEPKPDSAAESAPA
jgi:cytochrome bd-type quinol oxidase subunit 2